MAKSTMPGREHFRHSLQMNSILRLQPMIGNQAVLRLLQAKKEILKPGQMNTSAMFACDFGRLPVDAGEHCNPRPKYMVNHPGDKYEQEADRVADLGMRMPEPVVHTKPT